MTANVASPNRVSLFVPCHMDLFIQHGPDAVISILKKLGDECIYDVEQTCCGRHFFMKGEKDHAQTMAFEMLNLYCARQYRDFPIVIPSSACVGYIKKYLPELCATMALPADVKHMVHDTYELCDYIVNVKGLTSVGNTFKHNVIYFQTCAARNLYPQADEAAMLLLQNTNEITLWTDPTMKLCCSANGDFAMHNNEMSEHLLKMIFHRIKEYNVEYVTATDPHCLQYMDAYLQTRSDIHIEAIPIAEILNADGSK